MAPTHTPPPLLPGCRVHWTVITHDSFEEQEDIKEEVEGTLLAIVTGFLGLGLYGVVERYPTHIVKIPLRKLSTL